MVSIQNVIQQKLLVTFFFFQNSYNSIAYLKQIIFRQLSYTY